MKNEDNRSETNLNPESEINDTAREKDIPLVEQNAMITEVSESKSVSKYAYMYIHSNMSSSNYFLNLFPCYQQHRTF
jgi:hypothetical protein